MIKKLHMQETLWPKAMSGLREDGEKGKKR